MWQVSLSGIILATYIDSHIQEELDSMPEMHPTVINTHAKQEGSQSLAESGQIPIYKEFNKSFKLQYYIPVCCLLLYMDCAYKILMKQFTKQMNLFSNIMIHDLDACGTG